MTKIFGRHFLVEFIGCEPARLRRVEDVRGVLLEAARESGATIISHHFHQFEPEGVTGVILIAESHFALHTWPEDGYMSFDVLTCGEMEPEKAVDFLRDAFAAKEVKSQVIVRGF